ATDGLSRYSPRVRTMLSASALRSGPTPMMPSTSTMATLAPPGTLPSSITVIKSQTVPRKSATMLIVSPPVMSPIRPREARLLLLVVVVFAAALSPLLAAAGVRRRGLLEDGGQLLQRQPDAALAGIHPDHHERQLVARVDDLRRRADRAVGHVRDVQQPVHARLQLHEGAEVGEVPDLALHPHARLVALLDGRPRVALHLLHPQRDALGGLVGLEHHHLDHVPDVHELG